MSRLLHRLHAAEGFLTCSHFHQTYDDLVEVISRTLVQTEYLMITHLPEHIEMQNESSNTDCLHECALQRVFQVFQISGCKLESFFKSDIQSAAT